MFNLLDMGATGLSAQRTRMDTIAGNVLNINTTENERGEAVPYRRRFAVFQPGAPDDPSKGGVHVASIEQDPSAFRVAFEPGNKDADADGYVKYPNVNLETEFVNMLEASRAYEANVTMMETTKSMINASLRLLA